VWSSCFSWAPPASHTHTPPVLPPSRSTPVVHTTHYTSTACTHATYTLHTTQYTSTYSTAYYIRYNRYSLHIHILYTLHIYICVYINPLHSRHYTSEPQRGPTGGGGIIDRARCAVFWVLSRRFSPGSRLWLVFPSPREG